MGRHVGGILQRPFQKPNLPLPLQLIPQGVEQHHAKLVLPVYLGRLQHCLHPVESLGQVLRARELLLELREVHEATLLDQPAQLPREGDVLGEGALLALDVWEPVHQPLDVLDALEVRLSPHRERPSLRRLKLLGELLDGLTQLPKVEVLRLCKEGVVCSVEHHLLPDLLGRRGALQRHPVVCHCEALMEHRAVRPLVQQGGHWVVPPVEDQEHLGLLRGEVEEVTGAAARSHPALEVGREALADRAVLLKGDEGCHLE
mmetsp:Transcript_26044/g.65746  ORF Transcript_26044/g.65746 Transcript_26044/m.65746 type:complete len:259 (-) Transcript_26044:520-1296(-)